MVRTLRVVEKEKTSSMTPRHKPGNGQRTPLLFLDFWCGFWDYVLVLNSSSADDSSPGVVPPREKENALRSLPDGPASTHGHNGTRHVREHRENAATERHNARARMSTPTPLIYTVYIKSTSVRETFPHFATFRLPGVRNASLPHFRRTAAISARLRAVICELRAVRCLRLCGTTAL